jgi:hypothetical protein
VLQTITTSSQGRTSVSRRAAFKENVSQQEDVNPNLGYQTANVNIYPNPAENQVCVNFNVEAESNVLIELYDNTGQKIATLVNDRRKSGAYMHRFEVEAYELSHGTYIIRSRIGRKTATNSFIKL